MVYSDYDFHRNAMFSRLGSDAAHESSVREAEKKKLFLMKVLIHRKNLYKELRQQ